MAGRLQLLVNGSEYQEISPQSLRTNCDEQSANINLNEYSNYYQEEITLQDSFLEVIELAKENKNYQKTCLQNISRTNSIEYIPEMSSTSVRRSSILRSDIMNNAHSEGNPSKTVDTLNLSVSSLQKRNINLSSQPSSADPRENWQRLIKRTMLARRNSALRQVLDPDYDCF